MTACARYAPRRRSKHDKALNWVNALVLDLKLQLIGRTPRQAVTFDRLNEWRAEHIDNLERCSDPTIYHRPPVTKH